MRVEGKEVTEVTVCGDEVLSVVGEESETCK